jgi:hypothetical protein
VTEANRLQRFLATRDTDLDDVFWNAFIAVLETRFGAIEQVTAGYEAAKDALVERGLTQVSTQLAAIVASLNSTVTAAQQNLLLQVQAAQADAAAVEAMAVGVADSLANLQALAEDIESQIQAILQSNNLPATGVTVSSIATLTASNLQDALAEIVGEHNSYAAATSSLINTLASSHDALAAAYAAHAAAINPHGITAANIGAVPTGRSVTGAGLAQGGGPLSSDRAIQVLAASAAEYRSGAAEKALSAANVWAAMAEVPLADAPTIAWDMSSGIDFVVTLGGNRTLDNPTSITVGKKGRIRVAQDSAGSRTLSFASSYKFPGGVAGALSTAAEAADFLYYDCRSSTEIVISLLKDVR